MMMSSGRGRYAAQRALSKTLDRTSRRCGLASALIQRLPTHPDGADLRPECVRLQLVPPSARFSATLRRPLSDLLRRPGACQQVRGCAIAGISAQRYPGSNAPPALRGDESEPFVMPAGQGFSRLRFPRLYAPPVESID